MAYDQALADRIRTHLAHRASVTERQMFGGVGFMLKGNMAVGVHGDELIVRLAPAQHATAVAEPHARPFVIGGRSTPGFLLIAPGGTATDAALRTWIDRAVAHAGTLPAKAAPAKAKPKAGAAKAKSRPAAKPATSTKATASAAPSARRRRAR